MSVANGLRGSPPRVCTKQDFNMQTAYCRKCPCVDFPEVFHNVSFCFASYQSPSPKLTRLRGAFRKGQVEDEEEGGHRVLSLVHGLRGSPPCYLPLFGRIEPGRLLTRLQKLTQVPLAKTCRRVKLVLEAKLRQQWKLSKPTVLSEDS